MHIAEAIATDHYTAIQFVYRADNLCTIIAYQTDIIPVSKQNLIKIFCIVQLWKCNDDICQKNLPCIG